MTTPRAPLRLRIWRRQKHSDGGVSGGGARASDGETTVGGEVPMTEGMLYIVAMTALFGLWAYDAVSLYFDPQCRFLPKLYAWVRSDEEEDNRQQLV